MKFILGIFIPCCIYLVLGLAYRSVSSAQVRCTAHPSFTENKGQWPQHAEFACSTAEYTAYLDDNGLAFIVQTIGKDNRQHKELSDSPLSDGALTEYVVRLDYEGNPSPPIVDVTTLRQELRHYFLGNKSTVGVRSYDRVVHDGRSYTAEHEGIRISGHSLGKNIAISGVREIHLDSNGALHLRLDIGHDAPEIVLPSPTAWIVASNGKRTNVPCRYMLVAPFSVVAIADGNMDIDPEQVVVDQPPVFIARLDGSAIEEGNAVDIDSSKSIYVGGTTTSTNFPATAGVYNRSLNGARDCFVAKYTPEGQLLFATYIGGDLLDGLEGIAVNKQQHIFATGFTSSKNFPASSGCFQSKHGNADQGSDAFYFTLDETGSRLMQSTFLGGLNSESGVDVVALSDGSVVVVGFTESNQPNNFPTTSNAFQKVFGGGRDGFIAKFSPDASQLLFCSFLGGKGFDYPTSLATDANNDFYVVGETASTDFPTTPGSISNTYQGGSSDSFLTKIAADGSQVEYSSIIGGSLEDRASGVIVDILGNVYVSGYTKSVDFPRTVIAADTSHNGGYDAFAYKLNPTGDRFEYSTLLGGSADDFARGISIDACYAAYLSGSTRSIDFPIEENAVQSTIGGGSDFFLTKINADGNLFVYSTYIGGADDDEGRRSMVDSTGASVIVGFTSSPNFPNENGTLGGARDAIIAKIQVGILPLSPKITTDGATQFCRGGKVTLDVGTGYRSYQWSRNGEIIDNQTSPALIVTEDGEYEVEVLDKSGCIGINSQKVRVFSPPTLTLGSSVAICQGESVVLSVTSPDSLKQFKWTPLSGLDNDALRSPTASPSSSIVYYVLATDTNDCQTLDSIAVFVRNPDAIAIQQVDSTVEVCPGSPISIDYRVVNNDIASNRLVLETNTALFVSDSSEIKTSGNSSSLLRIQFAGATTEGLYFDTLTVTDSCGKIRKTPLQVRVGTPRYNIVSPPDTIVCRNNPAMLSVQVRNTGLVRLLGKASSGNPLFSVLSPNVSIAPGESAALEILFSGSAMPGIFSAYVVVNDSCGGLDSAQVTAEVEGSPLSFVLAAANDPSKVSGAVRTVELSVDNLSILNASRNKSFTFTISHERSTLEFDSCASDNCMVVFSSTDSTAIVELNPCRDILTNPLLVLRYKTVVGQTLQPQVKITEILSGDKCIIPASEAKSIEILPFGCEVSTMNVRFFTSSLSFIAPNPVGDAATIAYSTVEDAPVLLYIANPMGEIVRTIVRTVQKPGKYSVSFVSDGLSGGAYFVIMEAGRYRSSVPIYIQKQ